MSCMVLYLSGPMTDVADLNFPAFHEAAAQLRAHGYAVVNPAELHQSQPRNWTACMWTDIEAMARARVTGLAVLPGWENSRGASTEYALCRTMGLPTYPVQQWLMAKRTAPKKDQL